MRMRTVPLFAMSLLLSGVLPALAQDQKPMGPPNVLMIGRENVKPTKGAAHEKVESEYVAVERRLKLPTHYLAMTSISGSSDALFLIGYDSFAAAEKDAMTNFSSDAMTAANEPIDAKEGQLLSGTNNISAIYREDLSYQAPVNIYSMRYFLIVTVHVRPGHVKDFEEVRKMIAAAHAKANVSEHYAVYQAIAGSSGGTFMFFIPMKSLSELDDFPKTHGKAYQDALGEDGQNKIREMERSGVEETKTNIYVFSPKMSYLDKEKAGADADFWFPKPKSAAKPAAGMKKEAEKK